MGLATLVRPFPYKSADITDCSNSRSFGHATTTHIPQLLQTVTMVPNTKKRNMYPNVFSVNLMEWGIHFSALQISETSPYCNTGQLLCIITDQARPFIAEHG